MNQSNIHLHNNKNNDDQQVAECARPVHCGEVQSGDGS